jgi:hypothetical protein
VSLTVRIPRDADWEDPIRPTALRRGRDDIPEIEQTIRQAIADPGSFTGRGATAAAAAIYEYEDVRHWAARAVIIALEDAGMIKGVTTDDDS